MPAVPPFDEDPFFEETISDLEGTGATRRVVTQVDVLSRFATSADVGDDRRQLARRQLYASLERELLRSRGLREH